jgi:PAB-dependent poly(A)-specific ribonuclease subunit 3
MCPTPAKKKKAEGRFLFFVLLHLCCVREMAEPGAQARSIRSQQRCRNIALYGFCKFENRGCEFMHAPAGAAGSVSFGAGAGMDRSSSAPPDEHQFGMSASVASVGAAQHAQLQRPAQFHAHPASAAASGGNSGASPGAGHPRAAVPIGPRPGRRELSSFFVRDAVRAEIVQHHVLECSQLPLSVTQELGLPPRVHNYHNLVPLDDHSVPAHPGVFGFTTSVFKCTSSSDGLTYVIRRIEGYRPSNQQALKMGELWKRVRSPSVVPLSELFVSKDFGDTNSVFFASPYYPAAETLEQKYFRGGDVELLPEPILWTFLAQMLSALRVVHAEGFACRMLVPSKILVSGANRFRVQGCGIVDVLSFDGNKPPPVNQHEDLLMLGKLLLMLAVRSLSAVPQLSKSMEVLAANFSEDLNKLIVFLLTKPSGMSFPTVDDVATMAAPHLLTEIAQTRAESDLLRADLSTEIENGRMFRLMCKLGFVNERPEFEGQTQWSETGDRYLLKLFRDYVFHQSYEDGAPVVDMAHVVDCLNKLDAATDEKIMLMSRDEQSLLIVSYRDLNRCVAQVFSELVGGTDPGAGMSMYGQ